MPGRSQNSVTRKAITPMPSAARTTLAQCRAPASPARPRQCMHGSSTTIIWLTRCICRPLRQVNNRLVAVLCRVGGPVGLDRGPPLGATVLTCVQAGPSGLARSSTRPCSRKSARANDVPLVGILHSCLQTGTLYAPVTAWSSATNKPRSLTTNLLGCVTPVRDQLSRADRTVRHLSSERGGAMDTFPCRHGLRCVWLGGRTQHEPSQGKRPSSTGTQASSSTSNVPYWFPRPVPDEV